MCGLSFNLYALIQPITDTRHWLRTKKASFELDEEVELDVIGILVPLDPKMPYNISQLFLVYVK